MRVLPWICIMIFAAFASGCASLTGGNVQSLVVTTAQKGGKDVAGADCVVSNDKGNWRVKTPGETSIVRSNKAMTVKCDKEALPTGMATVESTTRGAMFGNILLGGVVGAAIDHTSGAAYEYPTTVRVVMGDIISIAPPPQPSGNGRHTRVHDKQFDLPPASGFANAADINAVPSEAARMAYADWLQKPIPRAFVLSDDGRPFWSSDSSASVQRAMDNCNQKAGGCHLYAYDDVVVWNATNVIAARSAETKQHLFARPAASGFASATDSTAIPFLGPRGREGFEHYLTLNAPKAFAIAADGGWQYMSNDPRAMKTALERCEAKGHQCWLYAVDNEVVWRSELDQRIHISQLNIK
jgi:hypothetical protein